ncbi:glycosyltransferase family 61 protein [uncultured Rhodoblastus sp.]|uniref:glycosyltransferase family 61 protein n=1 Tax=uncultured Rhodoblastus sp. TaxID=543037 RepID=UPI0025E1B7DB|nr:glycosyltransferase family 61 protein [uncultured Rhodoblastus sp.]
MAESSEMRHSADAYRSWLQQQAAATDLPRIRESLTWWLSCCLTGHGRLNADDLRVVVGDAAADLGERAIAIPQAAFPPSTTAVGWRLTDHPMIGADIGGAVLFGNGLALLEGRLYADCFRSCPAAWIDIGWFAYPETIGFCDFDISNRSCTLRDYKRWPVRACNPDDAYFFFNSNYGAENFGHFLHDTLAQLVAYDHFSVLRGRRLKPILSARLKYPMQRYLFERLIGPLDNALYLEDGPVRPAACFSATNAMYQVEEGLLSLSAMRTLRHRLGGLRGVGTGKGKTGRKLFISRADASNRFDRSFDNDDEVEALFVKSGFEPVVTSGLDPAETIEKFAECSVIAGVHGAGLLNGLFSQRQVRLVELIDYPGSWTSIHMVYSACGLQAKRIPSLAPTPESGGLAWFDLATIEKALSEIG